MLHVHLKRVGDEERRWYGEERHVRAVDAERENSEVWNRQVGLGLKRICQSGGLGR